MARGEFEAVYHPDRQVGWGFGIWKEMVLELVRSRELIWRLFIRDFTARYKQSLLGVLWAVIIPVGTVGTFVLLSRSGLMQVSNVDVPYPIYALIGMTAWQIFAVGLASASNSIVSGGGMIVKINFPKETMVIAGLMQAGVDSLLQVGLIAILFAWYGVVPHWTAIFFFPLLLPLVLLTLGLAFMFALLAVLMRDIPHVISLGTTLLLFATPVLYPRPAAGPLRELATYNPLAILIGSARDVVLGGSMTDPGAFAWATVVALGILLVSWRLFHMVEPRMAERV